MKKPFKVPCRSQAKIRGFTLIEVLVSVVIFSVGLLGLAGLQATGVRINHSSFLRSQATVLAYDITDSMRANRTRAVAGDYNRNFGDTAPAGASVAATDIVNWLTNLGNQLPSGDGQVAFNGTQVTVSVRWDDDRDGAPDLPIVLITDI